MSTPDSFPKPKVITGGCLCGSLKYRINFASEHDFTKASGTCQCTQDRKCTGSLWFQSHQIRPSSAFQFTSPTATLKHYSATSAAQRGFCGECGSFLYWKPTAGDDRISIAVGTVDALYLFGEGADGQDVPEGGFGLALVNGGGDHEWCSNEIKGVTDELSILGLQRGKRWQGDSA
ncbi:Mss4-like protein [Xylariales sp. AK1849]|nr:Mss4-like protein [Xylariales sp. AK1849]